MPSDKRRLFLLVGVAGALAVVFVVVHGVPALTGSRNADEMSAGDVAPAPGGGLERRNPMIQHLFKLVWNRRKANGLLLVELVASFLVLCAVLTLAGHYVVYWYKPLGFGYENVWRMDFSIPGDRNLSDERVAELWEGIRQLRLTMRDMEEIEVR